MTIKRSFWLTLSVATVLVFIVTISALTWIGEESDAHKVSRNMRKGMTVDEVTNQVGKPVSSISMDNATNSIGYATYYWFFDDSRLIVVFDPNGELDRVDVRVDGLIWRITHQFKLKFGL